MLGRDGNCASVETMRPEALNILADKWYVRLVFGWEETKEMAGSSLTEAEARLKMDKIPRKEVRVITHIIRAMRLLSHIGEGYAIEIQETGRVLSDLDALNVKLTHKNAHTSEEINEAISYLENFGSGTLAKKHAAVKRIVAQERLGQAVKMLRASLEMQPGNRRDIQIWAACTTFPALRDRIGDWRDLQIAWRMEYNEMKACSLRVLRDIWLLSRLVEFAKDPAQIQEYIETDRKKLVALKEIGTMLATLPTDTILKYMVKNSQLFRVKERKRKGAEEAIALAEEQGTSPKTEKKIDYLIGHYAWLYRHIRNGNREKANAKIMELEVFVHANKPRFIFDELEKGHEPYLDGTVTALRAAVAAFEERDFGTAQLHFYNAAEQLAATFQ